jgi:hypothetical protein
MFARASASASAPALSREQHDRLWDNYLDYVGLPPSAVPTARMGPAPLTRDDAPTLYLDTKDWISLAKARIGRPDGRSFRPCYDFLLTHTGTGGLRVVLSSASYAEVSRAVPTVRQRTELADVMSEISRFQTIRVLSQLLDAQFDQALHERLGRPAFPIKAEPFGRGVGFAFKGEAVNLEITLPPWPGIASAPDFIGGRSVFEELRFRAGEALEYVCLRGPRPEDVPHMPGYDLTPLQDADKEQVNREVELATMLAADPKLRSRLDDVVAARELYWTFGPELPRLLTRAAMSLDSFFYNGKDWIRDFLGSIPSIAVGKALKVRSFANASRAWSVNDLRDTEHLMLAVPYCDVVVTDRHAATVLKQAQLDQRLGTTILTDVRQLPDVLEHYDPTS